MFILPIELLVHPLILNYTYTKFIILTNSTYSTATEDTSGNYKIFSTNGWLGPAVFFNTNLLFITDPNNKTVHFFNVKN